MSGTVFHFESFDIDVFSGREIDLDCWRYACKAFGLRKMCMIDKVPGGTQVAMRDTEIQFEKFSSLKEFEAAHLDDTLIYLETAWVFTDRDLPVPTFLKDFKHPADENTWYIFGPAMGFAPEVDSTRTWVSILQDGRGAMHSVHVAPIVLRDRFLKTSGNNS